MAVTPHHQGHWVEEEGLFQRKRSPTKRMIPYLQKSKKNHKANITIVFIMS